MRNVMVRCIFSAISVGLCIVSVIGQEIHRYQWSDQQVLADEWKPFVPGFQQQRLEAYPQRPDSSRQFFGKTPIEPIQQNLYKKSFQTAASANNIEPYAVPPILGSFNTFGLQTIQARNPLLEKNIKDHQFLDQGSHLQPKYYPQNSQQPQRFPSAFAPPQQQYVPQQQHFPSQFRLDTSIKQPQVQPSRPVQTTVQIFPPNPPNHYQPNAYFLGVPQKQENYEDDTLSRKQNSQRPANDFLLNTNNIATIYGSRDPALNIPPPALKPTPFIRNEQQDPFQFENPNLKPVQRYETPNTYKRPYETQQIKQIEPHRRPEDNPSKQVYEQLSHFGRPFTLPRDGIPDTRVKPENAELDDYQNYETPVEHYKKDKVKTSQIHTQKTTYGRVPVNNAFAEVSTTSNQLFDYEPGKLQSVKTVTYAPQRDVVQFNEEDVPGGLKQYANNEKYNSFTRTPFLPTPMEPEEDPGYGNLQRLTTPPQKLTSTLPKNHKYVSMHHGTRNRYQQNHLNQEPPKYYTSTEPQQNAFEDKTKYAQTTQAAEYEEPQYETTTRKSSGRRRKPSKGTKTKDQTRHKIPSYTDTYTTSTINNDNYYASDATTEAAIQITTKKKQAKITTSKPEDDYPNYPQYVKQENYPQDHPNYPQYVKQQENYPKEYYQSTSFQNNYDNANTGAEYFNNEKQEEKENYPPTPLTTLSTTTTTPEPSTTASLKARIKNKYNNSTRPRFSIKDYKRTTTASTQSATSSTTEPTEETAEAEKKNIRKFAFASRSKNKTEPVKTSEEPTSESIRKYKPRTRPSKYRTTSTTVAADTTTERVYTFKPSTSNRYKTSTSKYYNRFRTTTEITTNDAEEPSVASSDKKPVRTMLFSAKRSSLLRPKSTTTPKTEETDDNVEEADDLSNPTVKKIALFKPNLKLDKADDASQVDIMTSSEEQNEKKEIKDAASEPIDITASSEEEMDDFSDILDMKENEVTTSSNPSAAADDRMDDADKVSQVSSLTSINESKIPMSFFQKWTSNENQKQ